MFWLAVLGILLLFGLSLRERMHLAMVREKSWDIAGEARPSPLSQALAGLVGTAGGIYLSLVMLFTFLQVQLPARVQMGQVQLEPLAAVSIALAIVQPFALRLLQLKRRY
ncbi:MAG: hypothetical protein IMW93_00880 [Thermoanaerobacteraceae bacterium]|nr:hypothetical protein [Thermoanaerobacteraceae bacterium]